ncbi:MAG: C1 family peptidase [Bacteroidota bacterium]
MRSYLILVPLFIWIPLSSWAQSSRQAGLIWDDDAYENTPLHSQNTIAKLAPAASLKAYAPYAKSQGEFNNCVGWSTAYAARTIMEAKTKGKRDRDLITQEAYAPGFIYKLISKDRSCYAPASIQEALEVMANVGVAKYEDISAACPWIIPKEVIQKAKKHRIDDFERLYYLKADNQTKVQSTKQALAEGKPVVIGMRCTPSFEKAYNASVWNPKEPATTKDFFGHAMCVVGYNDRAYGGAFEIMNSWGSKWGKKGFIWVRYQDFAKFAKYAYTLNSRATVQYQAPLESYSAFDDTWTSQPLPNLPMSVGMAAHIKLVDSRGKVLPVTLTDDHYKVRAAQPNASPFYIKLAQAKSSYVYFLTYEPGGKFAPYLQQTSSRAAWKSRGFYTLRAKGGQRSATWSRHKNRSYLVMLVAQRPLNILQVCKALDATHGSPQQRVSFIFGNRVAKGRNISFHEDKLAFSALKGSHNVSSMVVEARHR